MLAHAQASHPQESSVIGFLGFGVAGAQKIQNRDSGTRLDMRLYESVLDVFDIRADHSGD